MLKVKPAKGTRGFIIRTLDGYAFRVYNSVHDFIDYDILHFDMEVEILDDDAHLYEYDIGAAIDHAPYDLGNQIIERLKK